MISKKKRSRSFSAFAGALAIAQVIAAVPPADAACPSCPGSGCTITGTHTIGSGETCNYAGKDVILLGTFIGDNNAACYSVIADDFTLRGTLRARGSCIDLEFNQFKMEIVSNSASLVDVRDADSAGDGVTITCATAILNGNGINADADGDQSPTYFASGDVDITCSGDITGTGDPIHADGGGGDSGGTIALTSSGGLINLSSGLHVNGGGNFAFGGNITVDAAGNATLGGAAASRSLEAESTQGGFAGEVTITSGGAVTVNGSIDVDGNGDDADGGRITIDGCALTTGTTWNARSDQAGFGGSIDVFALCGSGTVTTTSGSASWNVQGASGNGGSIAIEALGDVSLSGDMDAGGVGTDAAAGVISITTDADIIDEATSRIEADSTGTDASDGTIDFTACNMIVSGDLDTRNTSLGGGTNRFTYAGTFLQNASSEILADESNDFFCRCPDSAPADGVCDSGFCINPPLLNGTVTPPPTLNPTPLPSCG